MSRNDVGEMSVGVRRLQSSSVDRFSRRNVRIKKVKIAICEFFVKAGWNEYIMFGVIA